MDTGHFAGKELQDMGICRKFEKIHIMSCLTRYDGIKIDPEVPTKEDDLSVQQYPKEKQSKKMTILWRRAILCH